MATHFVGQLHANACEIVRGEKILLKYKFVSAANSDQYTTLSGFFANLSVDKGPGRQPVIAGAIWRRNKNPLRNVTIGHFQIVFCVFSINSEITPFVRREKRSANNIG